MAEAVTLASLTAKVWECLVDESEGPRIVQEQDPTGIQRIANPLDPMSEDTLLIRVFRRLGFDINLARGSMNPYEALTDEITDPITLQAIEIIKFADNGCVWYAVWQLLVQLQATIAPTNK